MYFCIVKSFLLYNHLYCKYEVFFMCSFLRTFAQINFLLRLRNLLLQNHFLCNFMFLCEEFLHLRQLVKKKNFSVVFGANTMHCLVWVNCRIPQQNTRYRKGGRFCENNFLKLVIGSQPIIEGSQVFNLW